MGATSADQGSDNSDCMPGAGPAESGRPISNNQQPTDRCAHHALRLRDQDNSRPIVSPHASGTGQQPTDGTGIAADRSEKSRDAISVPEEWRDRIAAIVLLSAAIQNNITESGWSSTVACLTQFDHTHCYIIRLLAPIPGVQGSNTRGDHAESVRIGDHSESL